MLPGGFVRLYPGRETRRKEGGNQTGEAYGDKSSRQGPGKEGNRESFRQGYGKAFREESEASREA